MVKKYVVEARNADGSLNTKVNMALFPVQFITGISEDKLFDYYFARHNGVDSAGWAELYKFFNAQGLSIREKTW